MADKPKIYISCGDNNSLGLNDDNELLVQHIWWRGGNPNYDTINLGKLTDERIEELKGYLDRLRIHS